MTQTLFGKRIVVTQADLFMGPAISNIQKSTRC